MTTPARQRVTKSMQLPVDLSVVSSASVTLPVDPQAAGAFKALALGATLIAATTQLRTTVLESLGLQLRYSTTEQAYLLAAPTALSMIAASDTAEIVNDSNHLIRFRLRTDEEVLVRLNDAEALAIRLERTLDHASVLHTDVLASPFVAPRLWAPLSDWASEMAADEWLSERLRERAEQGDVWHVAVGIGELLRHARPVVVRTASESPVMHDTVPVGVARVVEELTERQLSHIVNLGAAQVRMIIDAVDELDDLGSDDEEEVSDDEEPGFRPQDADWQLRYSDVCAWREQVAAVDRLLDARGVVPFYRDDLRALDASAFHNVRGFLPVQPNDEGLHRAAYLDPLAWWVVPLDMVAGDT